MPPRAEPVDPTVFEENISDFDVGVRKRLRNGGEITAQGIYGRANQSPNGAIFNTSELRMTLTVPILRLFSPSEEASAEAAAQIDYSGALLTTRHVVTEAVLETTGAYWALRAAQERLALFRESEEAAQSLVRLTRVLIEADERPRSEVYQVNARLGEATTRRISAEQDLLNARQRLGVAMGLTEAEIVNAPFASQPFPSTSGVEWATALQRRYISTGLQNRADYMASLKSELAAQILLASARRNLLPRFDFQIRGSYFGGNVGSQAENISNSFFGNQTGVGAVGVVSLDWPVENRLARGQVVQARAQRVQASISTQDIGRSIASNVVTAIGALVNGHFQSRSAYEAAAAYGDAVNTERIRFEGGDATLLDVILIEERLTNAELSVVSARQQAAEAFARIRFETGTMLDYDGSDVWLDSQVLITLPSLNGDSSLSLPDFKSNLNLR